MMSLYFKYQQMEDALKKCKGGDKGRCWFYKGWQNINKGKLFSSDVKVAKDFKVTFDLKILGKTKGWSNIFRFTNGNQNLSKYGDRMSALWLWPGQTKLHYVVGDKGSANRNINTDKPLAVGKIMKIKLWVKGNSA